MLTNAAVTAIRCTVDGTIDQGPNQTANVTAGEGETVEEEAVGGTELAEYYNSHIYYRCNTILTIIVNSAANHAL